MKRFSSLMRCCSTKYSINDNNKKTSTSEEVIRREAADALTREAKKNGLISKSSGTVSAESSGSSFASVYSKRGEKGINQDCFVVWEEILSMNSLVSGIEEEIEVEKKSTPFDVWKESYLRTCTAVDKELKRHCGLDSFYSEEAERIIQSNGRVFCLHDEPGLQRLWLPDGETPGLAMSRAFGDYCVKDYGLISEPEVTRRSISHRDKFLVLATDGLWDVISNEEAVQIVASAPDRRKAAKRLVECANRAWKRKRRGIAVDDCSAVCLFFH
ncbi:putative protein phosphatase 2C 34 [Acorus calamus]|uniref:protein-serine/threonine phosphatase n=1 Tax=Acorus calamus TaxID=4465 RepID=A0AAV9CW90_ACOCL|nr:putative protein phosphatase 2C 34 [Acorus calamus]